VQQNISVRKKAFEYHHLGFHCAEAVSKAIIEAYGDGTGNDIPKVATAFGGGIGRTKKEICGALTGGIIAIGYLYGRNASEAEWDIAAEMAAKLRQRFVQEYDTTNCGDLLATFGPQENMIRCKQLSGEVAGMLADIIEEHLDRKK
jgi:C_GCAxxG_C_C family probable redox protein